MYKSELINNVNRNKFTKKNFCGVKALDELPRKRISSVCNFIVNTNRSDQPGEHWIAIHVPKTGRIEYFDSYGLPPYHTEFYKFFKLNRRKFVFNNHRIQSDQSQKCGKFALYFIYFRARNRHLNKFSRLFNKKNLIENDRIIDKLYSEILK